MTDHLFRARLPGWLLPAVLVLASLLVPAGLVPPAVPAGPVGLLVPAGPVPPAVPAGLDPPAGAAAVPAPAGGYRWPVAGPPPVTRPFDPPAQRWLPGHRGVDLAGAPGLTVSSAGAGVVFFAGPVAGVGVVSVDHPGGLRTTYQPLDPVVSVGDPVAAGEPVGVLTAGHSGCPVAACLHWGLRQGQHYLDPLLLLGLSRLRLLPEP